MSSSIRPFLKCFIGLFIVTASFASAQTCSGYLSQLNTPNTTDVYGGTGYTPVGGSFGTVCVTLNNENTVSTIVYTVNSGYLIGSEDALFANINQPLGTFTASATASTFGDHSAPSLTVENPPGTQPADGFGRFNVDAKNFDGFAHAFRTATLTVTLTTGTFENAASVLAYNDQGIDAGVHIFKCGSLDCSTTGGAVGGYVGEAGSSTTVVPEPASVALFSGVLLFTGIKLRMRFV